MFHLDFTEAQVITPCKRTIIYNYCDQNLVTDDLLEDGGQLNKQDGFRFSSSSTEKSPIVDVNI